MVIATDILSKKMELLKIRAFLFMVVNRSAKFYQFTPSMIRSEGSHHNKTMAKRVQLASSIISLDLDVIVHTFCVPRKEPDSG
jgi:hypothetical protein